MITFEAPYYLVLFTPLAIALVFLVLGYAMGRNSAERPFISSEVPEKSKDEGLWEDSDEEGYIEDEIVEPISGHERIKTIEE